MTKTRRPAVGTRISIHDRRQKIEGVLLSVVGKIAVVLLDCQTRPIQVPLASISPA